MSLPSFVVGLPAYSVIALSEASSNLSRFDGVRYGQRAQADGELAAPCRVGALIASGGHGITWAHSLELTIQTWVSTVASCTWPPANCKLLPANCKPRLPAELKSMYGKTRHDNIGSEVREGP